MTNGIPWEDTDRGRRIKILQHSDGNERGRNDNAPDFSEGSKKDSRDNCSSDMFRLPSGEGHGMGVRGKMLSAAPRGFCGSELHGMLVNPLLRSAPFQTETLLCGLLRRTQLPVSPVQNFIVCCHFSTQRDRLENQGFCCSEFRTLLSGYISGGG